MPNSIFFNKKAVSLTATKVVSFMILIFVVIIVISQFSNLTDTSKSGISDYKLKSFIEKCEISQSNCKVKLCDEENTQECSDVEIATWNSFSNYYKMCNKEISLSLEDYEKLDCGVLAKKIGSIIDGEIEIRSNPNLNFEIDSLKIEKLVSGQSSAIESFASSYNIDPNKLVAFLMVESAANAFDGNHPTVRFECLRFNKKVSSSERVSCNTDKYKYGNYEDTNKEAFLRALEINPNQAMLQSSFGLGQVMGFNYKLAGFNSVENYYKAMFDESEQVEAFLTFVLNNEVILSELQKDDTSWSRIAYNYNGEDYQSNNYDERLEQAYSRLS